MAAHESSAEDSRASTLMGFDRVEKDRYNVEGRASSHCLVDLEVVVDGGADEIGRAPIKRLPACRDLLELGSVPFLLV